MIKVRGTAVQGGLSIGPIRYLRREAEPQRRRGSGTAEELRRFEVARDRAIVELRRLRRRVAAHWGDSESIIFLVQSMMLDDEDYLRSIRAYIQDAATAEYAVSEVGKELVALFSSLDSTYMQARAADARDLSRRLASILAEEPDWGDLRQDAAVYWLRSILNRSRRDLEGAGVHCGSVTLGAIIATPAAVLHAGKIAESADFLLMDAHELVEITPAMPRTCDYVCNAANL